MLFWLLYPLTLCGQGESYVEVHGNRIDMAGFMEARYDAMSHTLNEALNAGKLHIWNDSLLTQHVDQQEYMRNTYSKVTMTFLDPACFGSPFCLIDSIVQGQFGFLHAQHIRWGNRFLEFHTAGPKSMITYYLDRKEVEKKYGDLNYRCISRYQELVGGKISARELKMYGGRYLEKLLIPFFNLAVNRGIPAYSTAPFEELQSHEARWRNDSLPGLTTRLYRYPMAADSLLGFSFFTETEMETGETELKVLGLAPYFYSKGFFRNYSWFWVKPKDWTYFMDVRDAEILQAFHHYLILKKLQG